MNYARFVEENELMGIHETLAVIEYVMGLEDEMPELADFKGALNGARKMLTSKEISPQALSVAQDTVLRSLEQIIRLRTNHVDLFWERVQSKLKILGRHVDKSTIEFKVAVSA